MKRKHYFYLILILSSVITFGGCTDSKEKAIDQLCLGLEKISDKVERNAIYMQCRKACGDAEIYNMEDGEKKNELIKKCVDAGKVGDTQFQKSPKRNWLGVMP